ncbi:MAG: T9SS C-terminal target domain-containing protein, partial [Bacteroidia bacterium]|nr:T9SS C-terminal target domain-containing protein [Bacteroidia bacterium]
MHCIAKEYPRSKKAKSENSSSSKAIGCEQTTAQAELSINNVRTVMQVGGDMWWDLSNPQYEIPKGSGKHSVFAGALWIGAIDDGGQLKVAAQSYRQTGIDFWAGPINTTTVEVEPTQCVFYDRQWTVRKQEVIEFRRRLRDTSYVVPEAIQSWPGNGDPTFNEAQFMAPFVDINGDGLYSWKDGDHPKYNLGFERNGNCNEYLYGDETIWWVFNDVGNVHTETSSPGALGLEIRAQAFASRAADEINDMTFYKYEVINRSNQVLSDRYFGQWIDNDLGNATDDYVGCDVVRGLGFCYNGDEDDETISGYGINPPAAGIDFFQGPIADLNDGIDNDRDGDIDEIGEQIIMSKFIYYHGVNSAPVGNPNGYRDHYLYLQGLWLDGLPITYGGDGRDPNAPVCSFMFPWDTDTFANTWSELTAGNVPADRRFLMSVGSFTMPPGAVQYISTGVVWARAKSGGNLASVRVLKKADDKAQALF